MTASPQALDNVAALISKGVRIPHPGSVYLGPEVDLDRISGDGVTIHPGCRLRGAATVVSAGCILGAEGPVTLDDSQLGPGVVLKGGYAAGSVFLARSSVGLGAHVREGSLLEEEASGAHCVGLKQTILFPYVTLGSLINFCDALMTGGRSRSDHSEVGSSYIHFNFTPDGNKTTASLFGDVPRGVMLDQPPIFLGGQGGAVGPVHTGFGTVVAAGSILRADVEDDGMLVMTGSLPDRVRPAARHSYRQLGRILERNLTYLANLDALDAWYRHVRRPFFEAEELGSLVYEGALRVLGSARRERGNRLKALAAHLADPGVGRPQLADGIDDVLAAFGSRADAAPAALTDAMGGALAGGSDYLAAVRALDAVTAAAGVAWLQGLVDARRDAAGAAVRTLNLDATA